MTLRKITVSVLLLALLSASSFGKAAQKESEPETLIKSTRFLEEKPLDKKAKDVRAWAITWVIQTDKVSVKVCATILSVNRKYKYSSEMTGQYTIGMAAFKLANPEKANDEDAAQLAGIESAIASYESILKEQPKAHDEFMDSLIGKRADGTLADYVKSSCKEKQ